MSHGRASCLRFRVFNLAQVQERFSPSVSCALGEPFFVAFRLPLTYCLLCFSLIVFLFISIRSSHPQIFVSYFLSMSQNGEALSNTTRPTFSSAFTPELTESQKQIVDKCTSIVQEFRSGEISKPKASLLLQQAIPHDDSNEESFLSVYGSYFDMLDNFEHYQDGNIGRINDVHQQLIGSPGVEQDVANEQPTCGITARPPK